MTSTGYWQSTWSALKGEARDALRELLDPAASHHVFVYQLEYRNSDQRTEMIRKVDSDYLWVLARVHTADSPGLAERLASDVLGPGLLGRALDSTDFLRTVHLSTPFRLESKRTFARRGLRLELLQLRRR